MSHGMVQHGDFIFTRNTKHFIFAFLLLTLSALLAPSAQAACGATDRTWTGGTNTAWGTAGNWAGNNIPDTNTENAIIPAASRNTRLNLSPTVSCVTITSGIFEANNTTARTLTITGDYFSAPNLNSINFLTNGAITLSFAGTASQTLTAVDMLNFVNLASNHTLTITESVLINNGLTFTGSTSGTLRIQGDVDFGFTGLFTIPTGITVIVESGASLSLSGSMTINGTLQVENGASVVMPSASTLTVNSTGVVQLNGTSGNVATLMGQGSSRWNMNMGGTMSADYFRIDRVGTGTTGMNITGTVSTFTNGEFHYINSAGYAMTWGAAASLPANMDDLGFFDDLAYGNNGSINASAYTGAIVALDNWSGLGCTVEGCAKENDPANKVDWQNQAGVVLTLSSQNNSGKPVNPVVAGAVADEQIVFSFNLNQASAATDITQIKLTLTGSADANDVDFIRIYDQGASCLTLGAQIGTDLTMSGSPATATFNIPAATMTTDGTSAACVHVWIKTSASADDQHTLGVEISGTNDVVNSAGYSFSPTSGPPVGSSLVTINGDPTKVWDGSASTAWRTNNNWNPSGWPNNILNCRIGSGVNIVTLTATEACQNMTLLSGGTVNFNNAAHMLDSYGSLSVQSSFIFQNAASASLRMAGSTSQSIEVLTAFPGALVINNTGASSVVSTSGNVTINGNLTVQDGIFRISAGHTVTILGNVTVSSGATLDIEPGGVLTLGNTGVLTIDLGGTLEMIGNGQLSTINATAPNSYTVNVNGTIKASNYSFSNLGLTGVTINSGATIDGVHYLQNGTFAYPQANNTDLLRLFVVIPGHTLSNMTFTMGGSSASAATINNIVTNVVSGTNLSVTSFSGDLGGPVYESETNYLIDWAGQVNNYKVTIESSAPASANQGTTYVAGRFGFQQDPGAIFNNMNITSLKFTLYGTGSASDITDVKLRTDTNCDGTYESELANGPLGGNPASVTFSGLNYTVEAGASPPKRCLIVVYTLSGSANNSKTVGARIVESGDIVNDQSYNLSSATPVPREAGLTTIIGSSTTWTGTVSTVWTDAGNWTGGVPTASLNCSIADVANDPVISSGTQTCRTLSVSNGTLTINAGTTLQVGGNVSTSGTINNSGTIEFVDGGVTLSQSLSWASGNMGTIRVSGTANPASTLTFTNTTMTVPTFIYTAGTSRNVEIRANRNITFTTGVNVISGTLRVLDTGKLKIGNGQTLTVSGGTFIMSGTEEAYPQQTTNKATLQETSGTGTFDFVATSGTVYLGGFLIENLSTNGLQINGTTNLTRLHGGQFRNLSTSYGSVRVIQLNTTGTIPALSTDVGWNWGPNNLYPANTEAYKLISSSGNGCNGASIDFSGFFGDWMDNTPTFDISTKVTQVNCTISLSAAASAVSLLSFTATPYNGSVDLEWETALEQDHKGFNVYRADAAGNYFVQINSQLIRNIVTNTSARGKYRFIDNDVENGVGYNYYVEDVAQNGVQKELHGPKYAVPLAGLGSPPVTDPLVNNGNLGDDGQTPASAPGTIINPSFKDLGNGIVILSQTSTGLRLWITPGALTYAASGWNGSYQTVSMNGYSKYETQGEPELLQRTILVEVNPWTTQASVTNITATSNNQAGHLLAPAPSWSADGSGVLQASYNPNAASYSINNYLPSAHVSVESSLYSQGGRKFLKVTVHPIRYNADQQIVKLLSEAVVDIGLVGDAWEAVAPNNDFTVAPEIVSGTLQIAFAKTGVYEFSYDDLLDSSVEGPFTDILTSDLRLYLAGEEIPLAINSADGVFNAGDTIRFFVNYFPTLEDNKNVVVLSARELVTTGQPALRIQTQDADPTAVALNAYETVRYVSVSEQNNFDLFSEPVGEGIDHFIWKRIYAPTVGPLSHEYVDMTVAMPGHDSSSTEQVKVHVYLKGHRGNVSYLNYRHHMGLWVNALSFMAESADWLGQDYQVITYSLPASYFHHGTNKIRAKALATYVEAGDSDVIAIDKIEVEYWGSRIAQNGQLLFNNYEKDTVVNVSKFLTNDISVYDVSDVYNTRQYINGQITTPDGGSTYDIAFNTVSAGSTTRARRFFAFVESAVNTPTAFIPTYGAGSLLKSGSNQADMIVIGPQYLLSSVSEWKTHRESQGISVALVSLEQIYAEFNNGVTSSSAIKIFVNHALNSWAAPAPQYMMLIGGVTYDPRNYFDLASDSYPRWPAALVEGRFSDFASDNWFGASFDDAQPLLSVGRLPFTNPTDIEDYLQKVMDYEAGDRAPTEDSAKDLTFIADHDSGEAELFDQRADNLASLTSVADNGLITQTVLRGDYANTAAFKSGLISKINEAPLLLTYIGHGAEDIIGDTLGAVYMNLTDAKALSNTRLPIMLALNCLNVRIDDPSIPSLGESLLGNADGGVIAMIGSTAMTTPVAQTSYATEFFNLLGQKLGQNVYQLRLGDIFTQAKTAMHSGVYNRDVLQSYSLFGDPSLILPEESFSPKSLPITAPAPFTRPTAASSGGGGCSVGASEAPQTGGLPWQALEWPMWFCLLYLLRRPWRKQSSN